MKLLTGFDLLIVIIASICRLNNLNVISLVLLVLIGIKLIVSIIKYRFDLNVKAKEDHN